jgi:tRNA modification GTPase
MADVADTIVALATAPGPGARAIIRLSGPDAHAIASAALDEPLPAARGLARLRRQIRLRAIDRLLRAEIYLWVAPRSYTGQDLVELHVISSPPLVQAAIAELLAAGARAAGPGEFTLRAFLAGKVDLASAEAVLGVIAARNRDELRRALTQMAGGTTEPLDRLRHDLLDLLADIEAGLDFADEDIRFIGSRELLDRLTRAMAQITVARRHFDRRSLADQPFRVAFAGKPNAGKSSLVNALADRNAALVAAEAGTTRDYVVVCVSWQDTTLELIDTAGLLDGSTMIETQAQELAGREKNASDLIVHCLDASAGPPAGSLEEAGRAGASVPVKDDDAGRVLLVATKCDIAAAPPGRLPTSSVTGAGVGKLREILAARAHDLSRAGLSESFGRCGRHLDLCLEHLRRSHSLVLFEDPMEILALELRSALDELGHVVGAVYTDDLLDRIFSRFCIGK